MWSPPPQFSPQPKQVYPNVAKKSKVKRILSEIAGFFDVITIILLLAICSIISFMVAALWPPSEELTAALEQEYGYSEIVQIKGMNAKVITTDGEEKVVDVLEYKNTTVFFENQEQMNEKVSKVQAGTYPEVLSNL